MNTIWVLGATGLSGRAIARELAGAEHGAEQDAEQGAEQDVVLIGRNADRLAAVAASLASPVHTRVASGLTELAGLIAAEKPAVVVNTVGPFTSSTVPLARASLSAGSHYVDLANELEPVRQLLALDGEARRRDVTLVTGAGFGVLATEALVIELRGDRPAAARARVAAMPTVDGLGSAVLASAVDAVAYGGRRYRDGRLVRTRLGANHELISLPDSAPTDVLAVPTGELEAARRASGAGDVLAYSSEVPSGRLVRAVLPTVSVLLAVRPVQKTIQWVINRKRLTPPARAGHESWAYARLEWDDGTRREAWLHTGEGYRFTARIAARTAARLADGSAVAGAYTPGALFGADAARWASAEIVTSGDVTT